MNWLPRFAFPTRHSRETGSSTGRRRLFVYLAVTVIALLLSYQLVLNREALSSVSQWAVGKGLAPAVEHVNPIPETGPTEDQPQEPSENEKADGGPESQLESQRPQEKELVLAAMSYSNMSWVQENVPHWYTNIYRADVPPGEADLTVPVNKGNEAMVFLTFVYLFPDMIPRSKADIDLSYIIDRYDSLPDVVVFMHGGRYQWHNDNPLYGMYLAEYRALDIFLLRNFFPTGLTRSCLTPSRLRHIHQRPPTRLRPRNRLRQPPLLLGRRLPSRTRTSTLSSRPTPGPRPSDRCRIPGPLHGVISRRRTTRSRGHGMLQPICRLEGEDS